MMVKSNLSKSLRADRKAYRDKVLERLCSEIKYAATASTNGKVPYGFVNKILSEIQVEEPWVTRSMLNHSYRKYCEEGKVLIAPSSKDTKSCAGGRPVGSTHLKKHHLREVLFAAKNEIATIYLNEKEKYKEKGLKLPNGWLNNKIAEISAKRGVPTDISISASTIRKRTKGKMVVQGGGPESLMASVEPHLIELILSMAEIRRCLSTSEAIALANDLISGTPTESRIIEWKKQRNEYREESPVLGSKWWQLFKKRWSHRLVTKRGQKFAMDRSCALTYSNVRKMYDDVYKCMVDAGVARKLDVISDNFPGQLKTEYELIHPEMCLVVDEVGSNISQRGDGHIAGKKYCCEKGYGVPQNKSSINDRHFTVLGFTALTGEPVLCVIIVAGVIEAYEVETGIDIDASVIGDPTDKDYFQNNAGKGKLFPKGPDCIFNGKTVPCLVRWSPSGSITSKILADCLATMDHYDLFARTDQKRPFLLLDGHGSRFELPFLQYVTNADHPWMVCQGVPYGTSLWQVADSSEQNGCFKIACSEIKEKLLKKRLDMMIDSPSILPTDIVPIVNYSWDRSFAKVATNKKAIAARGWCPLNYNLLTNTQIQPTMTKTEMVQLCFMMKEVTQQSSTTPDTSVMLNSTSLSDLTDDREMNYDPFFLKQIPNTVTVATKLNFKIGRASHVARTLLHESDILHAREENKKSVEAGKKWKEKLEGSKKLSAMLNFKAFGCRIGEDSLKARLAMAEKKENEEARIMQKKNDLMIKRQNQYIDLQKKIAKNNIPVEKLSLQQLKVLCMHKKRDDDKVSISKLKRPGLLALWLIWQSRPDIEVSTIVPQGLSQHNVDNNPVVIDHGVDTMIVDDNVDVMEI